MTHTPSQQPQSQGTRTTTTSRTRNPGAIFLMHHLGSIHYRSRQCRRQPVLSPRSPDTTGVLVQQTQRQKPDRLDLQQENAPASPHTTAVSDQTVGHRYHSKVITMVAFCLFTRMVLPSHSWRCARSHHFPSLTSPLHHTFFGDMLGLRPSPSSRTSAKPKIHHLMLLLALKWYCMWFKSVHIKSNSSAHQF
jgi:hypothetical protein